MSYSFGVIAATKSEACEKVDAEFTKVVASQPPHAADKQAAQDAVTAFIDVLRAPAENEVVGVSVSGSLTWQTEGSFSSASVNVSAWVGPPR